MLYLGSKLEQRFKDFKTKQEDEVVCQSTTVYVSNLISHWYPGTSTSWWALARPSSVTALDLLRYVVSVDNDYHIGWQIESDDSS